MFDFSKLNMTLGGLQQHYQHNDFSPAELVDHLRQQSLAESENPVWIHLLDEAEIKPYLDFLADKDPADLPLYGIPFAIKDNIDLAGVATTAACPDFSYEPTESAHVVARLLAAGALPMGKTNLDQFATGLVGVRSPEPWGPCQNALNPDYISGGSSSGSGVAVAKGWVCFSLGTDTAGSGRIPAAMNNIVGLKPSCGVLSTRGVVPACRSLDCVSIFALTCEDANRIFDCVAQYDPLDDYSRPNPFANGPRYFSNTVTNITLGIPSAELLAFFGNQEAQRLFQDTVEKLKSIAGLQLVEIDFTPFKEAAKLLYEGAWVAERYLATSPLIKDSPESMLPVIQTIIGGGDKPSALDTFSGQYKLRHYRQLATQQLAKVDAIVTPTAGSTFTIDEVLANPIEHNSQLGYYTNFMNLLDCSAVAIPTGFYPCGVGFGITLFHEAFADKKLLSIAACLQRHIELPLGALSSSSAQLKAAPTTSGSRYPQDCVDVVVCGAHLDGLPLNWQLKERGGKFIEAGLSSPNYELYALAGGPPFRPGMVRVEEGGSNIEVEVWRLPLKEFGSFVAEIPAPLGIGKVELEDGRWLCGFMCEGSAIKQAENITHLGGWRSYMKQKNP